MKMFPIEGSPLRWLPLGPPHRIILCGLLCLCGGAAFADSSLDELIDQLAHGERDEQREAAYALARFGPEAKAAVPQLAEALTHRDSQVWQEATRALANLGPAAEPALEALLDRLGSSDAQRKYRTAHALGRIGKAAVPSLREALSSDSRHTRAVAVQALGWVGDDALVAVRELIERLDDEDEEVRQLASSSLARLGEATVPQLIEALSEAEVHGQHGAASALAAMGPAAAAASDSLLRLASQDPAEEVLANVLLALAAVETRAPQVVDVLLRSLKSSDRPLAQQAAVDALVRLTPELQPQAAKQLANLLESDNSELLSRTAVVLGAFGTQAHEALPALIRELGRQPEFDEAAVAIGKIGQAAVDPIFVALRSGTLAPEQVAKVVENMPAQVRDRVAQGVEDENPRVREVAALTIARTVPLPASAATEIGERLADTDAGVRRAAATALGELGKKGREALPALHQAITGEANGTARATMIRTLGVLETDDSRYFEVLSRFLSDRSEEVQREVLDQLGRRAALPTDLASRIVPLTNSETASLRSAALRALGQVDGAREQAIESLVAALTDPQMEVRRAALQTLAGLDEEALPALDPIRQQLESDAAEVRIAAVEALAGIGREAADTFDRLAGMVEGDKPEVRVAVIKNIRSISRDVEGLLGLLVNSLEDEDWTVRRFAAEQLGDMEEDAAPAIPALLESLRRDDDNEAVRGAIRNINTAGTEAIPTLLDILQDRGSGRRPRYYALYLLRKMGRRAESALPTLKELSEKADGQEREYLDRAIREIEEELES